MISKCSISSCDWIACPAQLINLYSTNIWSSGFNTKKMASNSSPNGGICWQLILLFHSIFKMCGSLFWQLLLSDIPWLNHQRWFMRPWIIYIGWRPGMGLQFRCEYYITTRHNHICSERQILSRNAPWVHFECCIWSCKSLPAGNPKLDGIARTLVAQIITKNDVFLPDPA